MVFKVSSCPRGHVGDRRRTVSESAVTAVIVAPAGPVKEFLTPQPRKRFSLGGMINGIRKLLPRRVSTQSLGIDESVGIKSQQDFTFAKQVLAYILTPEVEAVLVAKQGVYRVSSRHANQTQVLAVFRMRNLAELPLDAKVMQESFGASPFLIADTLKTLIRGGLPALISPRSESDMVDFLIACSKDGADHFGLIDRFFEGNLEGKMFFKDFILHLWKVSQGVEFNGMTASNLATCVAPNFYSVTALDHIGSVTRGFSRLIEYGVNVV